MRSTAGPPVVSVLHVRGSDLDFAYSDSLPVVQPIRQWQSPPIMACWDLTDGAVIVDCQFQPRHDLFYWNGPLEIRTDHSVQMTGHYSKTRTVRLAAMVC